MLAPQTDTLSPLVVTEAPEDLTAVFRRVNNVLPERQDVCCVSYETSVSEVLALMKSKGYSQIPIKAGGEVLGVFSYRSFADRIPEVIGEKVNLEQLQAGDFMESTVFVGVREEWTKTLDMLDRRDAVLVGSLDNLQGVLTAIDLVRYLYKQSSPFVLLGEIELALRHIIRKCVSQDQLREITQTTLSKVYQPDRMPASPEEMTLNDYVQVVGDGRAWSYFEVAFGRGDWQRKKTRAKLEEIRDLRNIVFHFKREVVENDIGVLVAHRDWIKNVLTAYQVKKAGV